MSSLVTFEHKIGQSRQLQWQYSEAGLGVTGLVPTVLVRRDRDGYYWDGGLVWDATPTPVELDPVDAAVFPGLYAVTFPGGVQDEADGGYWLQFSESSVNVMEYQRLAVAEVQSVSPSGLDSYIQRLSDGKWWNAADDSWVDTRGQVTLPLHLAPDTSGGVPKYSPAGGYPGALRVAGEVYWEEQEDPETTEVVYVRRIRISDPTAVLDAVSQLPTLADILNGDLSAYTGVGDTVGDVLIRVIQQNQRLLQVNPEHTRILTYDHDPASGKGTSGLVLVYENVEDLEDDEAPWDKAIARLPWTASYTDGKINVFTKSLE